MKILLCNDDGYQAQGIEALYAALRCVADVQVIAPEFNNSAKSNALTLHAPLYVQQAGNINSFNGIKISSSSPRYRCS